MRETIAICLATYNGARFLREQLESIWAQAFSDWHLYVRDDGSTDGTVSLLMEFAERNPERVTILPSADGQLGVKGNFERLARASRAPYLAFSDQDDVWHPDKLTLTLRSMQSLEATLTPATPILIHSDRRLIDADGQEITPSYWISRGLDAAQFDFGSCLTFSFAAGSTMLANRRLVDRALPIPDAARMHDNWIELVAYAFGEVSALDKIVIDHRRHGGNASGALQDIDSPKERRTLARAQRLLSNLDRQRRIYASRFRQAEAFRDHFGPSLDLQSARQLDRFLAVRDASIFGRLAVLLPNRARPPGLVRSLVFAILARARESRGTASGYKDSGL